VSLAGKKVPNEIERVCVNPALTELISVWAMTGLEVTAQPEKLFLLVTNILV